MNSFTPHFAIRLASTSCSPVMRCQASRTALLTLSQVLPAPRLPSNFSHPDLRSVPRPHPTCYLYDAEPTQTRTDRPDGGHRNCGRWRKASN